MTRHDDTILAAVILIDRCIDTSRGVCEQCPNRDAHVSADLDDNGDIREQVFHRYCS